MKLNRRSFIGSAMLAAGVMATGRSIAAPPSYPPFRLPPATPAPAQPPVLVRHALAALDRHAGSILHRDRLGIADYTAHSGEYRFQIVDIVSGSVLQSLLVSHGRGSDPANTGLATSFSNLPGSNASSRGSFVTGEAYVGKHGRSRRLHGLEPENDRAFERAIVIHGADYVDSAMAEQQGRVGRSLGCFAFEQSQIAAVLELLGAGRLLFAAA